LKSTDNFVLPFAEKESDVLRLLICLSARLLKSY